MVKSRGFEWSGCSFDLDLNSTYGTAMNGALGNAVREYDLVSSPLTPADVKARGYDGFVVIQQTNATGSFWPVSNFWFQSARSEIALSAIIAVADEHGVFFQQQVNGRGVGDSGSVWGCSTVSEAVANASKAALEGLIRAADSELRAGLEKRRDRGAASATSPGVPLLAGTTQ